PWYVIPADHKWFSHLVVAKILTEKLESLHSRFPVMSADEHKKNLAILREELKKEKA
ncbi:MAG: polyphosphate kinase 2 family protein, partial [Candidatus Sungbacteria bacterium]|nr:polyphosphate kinase 2 family protein [Candidatus Sungbacteria bacterium]